MTFRLPYPPSVNRLYRVLRGRMVMSDAARDYKRLAATSRAGTVFSASLTSASRKSQGKPTDE